MILAIIAVSGVVIYTNLDAFTTNTTEVSKAGHSALFMSNVEVVQRDGAGNIVAYRQGANHIVDSGMEIIARQVFGPGANPSAVPVDASATQSNNTNVTGGWGGRVQFMEIGNGTGASISGVADCGPGAAGGGPVLGWDNKTLECPLSVAFGCARELAVIHRFNATEDPTGPVLPTDAAQINMTAVATFSGGALCAFNNRTNIWWSTRSWQQHVCKKHLWYSKLVNK